MPILTGWAKLFRAGGAGLAACILSGMMELTQLQMLVVERLFSAGLRPIAIPPYEKALCMHRGECAVLLEPVENGGLKMLATPTFLVNGNLSVRVKRASGEAFVFKKDAIEATPERLRELEAFRAEVVGMLEMTGRA
jgi:hypothetical protein